MLTLIDAARLLLATAACGLVIALPGIALARIVRLERDAAIVVGLAVLPLIDSLTTRAFGLDTALAVTLALAMVGVACLATAHRGVRFATDWPAVALGLAWIAVVVVEWVDFDVAGRLYQPFTVIDTVKHAATTQAILDGGAPPHDPFFLRPERASYYYFFYALPALAMRLGGGLLDARAAVGGALVWVGFGLYGLVRLASRRAGLPAPPRLAVVALLAASGLDILGVLRMGLLQGTWLPDPAYWNEQATGWVESLIWVPHHVTGLIAGMLGLIALAGLDRAAPGDARRGIALAALCFASALGLSVWLTLALVATAALWAVALLRERRWRLLGHLAIAGALALGLALPQIHDLVAGRSGGETAIVPTIRAFTPVDGLFAPGLWRDLARLVALPINYFAGFGILASGTLLYLRLHRTRPDRPEFARVLVLAAAAGLALGAFLKSTLFNNDLGWRVVEYPLFAATIWTLAALRTAATTPAYRIPGFSLVLLGLGWATTLYALVQFRAYPWLVTSPDVAFMSADPATERALRLAYAAADRTLPATAVLQHNPTRPRAFAFSLYGRHRVAVADTFGSLFGADPRAVDARIAALAPVFTTALPAARIRAIARADGIDDLVVTAEDPVWSDRAAPLWRAAPAYASDRVRIIPVANLPDDAPAGTPDTRRRDARL